MSVALGPAALTERVYVSQFTSPRFGLTVHIGGVPADADAPPTVTVHDEAAEEDIATLTAESIGPGVYEVQLSSQHTAKPGYYTLNWSYQIDGGPEVFASYVEVGQASPAYDELPEEFKDLVDTVWVRFADTYDSPDGGPHVQVELQTHFNRGRFAQLLHHALGRLNTKAQPQTTYVIPPQEGKGFSLKKWGGVLELALYVEVIRHLMRSYTEQPEVVGANIARLDRRDYVRRWGDILQMEQEDLEDALDVFKIAHMGLGRPSVMVSGGVYGTYSPTRISHATAARPRYWARFY